MKKKKQQIFETLCLLGDQNITDEHLRWEYLKYEIRKFTKKNCKSHSRKCKKGNRFSRNITSSLNRYKYRTSQKYLDCKLKLDEIYSKQSNGVRTRSKCDWYESSEKSNKFFLNLEETLTSQGLICSLVKNENEINDPVEINTEL